MRANGIIILLSVILMACGRTEFKIRASNMLLESIDSLKVGPVYFGTVQPGVTTSYFSLADGLYNMYGLTASGDTLSGSIPVAGNTAFNESHAFTLSITSDSTFTFIED